MAIIEELTAGAPERCGDVEEVAAACCDVAMVEELTAPCSYLTIVEELPAALPLPDPPPPGEGIRT